MRINPDVKRARRWLARELAKRGALVFYVDVPEGLDGTKQGVDDWLGAAGPVPALKAFDTARCASAKVPAGFGLSGTGVFATDPTGGKDDVFVCSRLEVTACTRNADGEEWGRLLEWQDHDGLVHAWAMPMSILSGDENELRARLLSGGLEVSPNRKARELLTIYIQAAKPEVKTRCVSRVGWHGDSFVLPDVTIGPHEGERVLFQSAYGSEHSYRVAGSLDDWRAQVGRLCSGNSRLLFAVSCAFAGPLLDLTRIESGGFHLRGPSSIGKTTLLMVAGSCWGGGGHGGFTQTWRATANGLEAVAELHNHSLLCLDELGQVDPKEAGEVAYLLANGMGKSRMTRTIQLRKTLSWNVLFLSSGEISLADHVRLGGGRSRAGQEVRLVDIEADVGAGMGVFENLHGGKSADEFARCLVSLSKSLYGTPAREFLQFLAKRRSEVCGAIQSFGRGFQNQHVPAGSAGEVSRAANRFALVAAAGELATEAGITGWKEGEAEGAASVCFESWLNRRGSTGVGDVEAAIQQVRAFLEAHGASRFQSLETKHDRSGSPVQERVINRVGFKSGDADGKTEFLVLPQAFRAEVCRGFDHRMVSKALAVRGYLNLESAGEKHSVRRNLPKLGRTRVYAIRASILGDELE